MPLCCRHLQPTVRTMENKQRTIDAGAGKGKRPPPAAKSMARRPANKSWPKAGEQLTKGWID